MYERGYDIVDIKEQEQVEYENHKYCNALERECIRRGIELWKEYDNDKNIKSI